MNFYQIKLIRKYNFNLFDSNVIIFEVIYKRIIVITDINNVLCKLRDLSLKGNKIKIDKLINLIRVYQKINKFFNFKIVFAFFILSIILTSLIFEKIIKFFIKICKIMYLNNAQTSIVDKIEKIIRVILYRQLINLSVNVLINFEQMSI